jgi:hypothetical protein
MKFCNLLQPLGLSLWVGCLGSAGGAIAQIAPHTAPQVSPPLSESIVFQEAFDPPGEDKPDDTAGAGARDGARCQADEDEIEVLMPRRNYGLTLASHPTVFVNFPKTSATQVRLLFRDEMGGSSEAIAFPVPQGGGLVGFRLSEASAPLEVGKNYQWFLSVSCAAQPTPNDPVFVGWVQRVALNAERQGELAAQSTVERVQWYASHGYWYDLLATLSTARRQHPEDPMLGQLWTSVLESVGLSAIAFPGPFGEQVGTSE